MTDLFNVIVAHDKLHENFKKVNDYPGHEAAKRMVNEIFNSISTIDKDFIQQFQTIGFDARIWELSLLAGFLESGFQIERKHDRPDFELVKNNQIIFVEAVTSGSKDPIEDKLSVMKRMTEENAQETIIELMKECTIKLAGSLTSKLKKNYWELPWVVGHSLILAVQPFHHSLTHLLSDNTIIGYLYGMDNLFSWDEDGKLNANTQNVDFHQYKEKQIPSNFFKQPGSENISAVIFSSAGTIGKFNRMGTQKGYGRKDIKLKRKGMVYSLVPGATEPLQFLYTVGIDGPKENWMQGISMYHNPAAEFPIDPYLFPNILHGFYDNGYSALVPEFWPISSETQILIPRPK